MHVSFAPILCRTGHRIDQLGSRRAAGQEREGVSGETSPVCIRSIYVSPSKVHRMSRHRVTCRLVCCDAPHALFAASSLLSRRIDPGPAVCSGVPLGVWHWSGDACAHQGRPGGLCAHRKPLPGKGGGASGGELRPLFTHNFKSALLGSHACTLAHGCTRMQELCSGAACWAPKASGIKCTEGSGRSTVA